MDEQVLAIDVPNQILLVRVEGSGAGGRYLGVLAIAKDPSKLSVKNSESAWAGQYAQTIANNNNGVLAMTASGCLRRQRQRRHHRRFRHVGRRAPGRTYVVGL